MQINNITKISLSMILMSILFVETFLCTELKNSSITSLGDNRIKKLNQTLAYFKSQITEQTKNDLSANNLLDEMLGNLKAPKFNDIKNKQERWQQNVCGNSANERHMQDIIEYVQNSMIKQSNIELKTLLSDSQYDFLF